MRDVKEGTKNQKVMAKPSTSLHYLFVAKGKRPRKRNGELPVQRGEKLERQSREGMQESQQYDVSQGGSINVDICRL